MRREATWISQARGLSGTPSRGHCVAAAMQRFLDRVLGRGEVAKSPDDRAQHLRRELAQQVLGRVVERSAPSTASRQAARSSPVALRSPC